MTAKWLNSQQAADLLGYPSRAALRGKVNRGTEDRVLDRRYGEYLVDLALDVEEEEDEDVDGTSLLHNGDYVYDKDQDRYVTFLKASPRPVVMPGARHRALIQAYSNWDGSPSTINEICREFLIPRPWLVEYLRLHGITHDREPFSAEELLERDSDELVEDALQMRRLSLHRGYEVAKWREIKKAAEKWERLEQEILSPLLEAVRSPSRAPREVISLDRPRDACVAVLWATDFHYGMRAWRGESGPDSAYDPDMAEEYLHSLTEAVLADFPDRLEEIIMPVGSDWFHVDGQHALTTRGTPQDLAMTPTELFVRGCQVAAAHVEKVAERYPVRLIQCAGNHDRANGIALLMYLSAYFRDHPNVVVVEDFRPRIYLRYGKTLIGFHHGDKVKPRDLLKCALGEAPEMVDGSRHRYFFGGHEHHRRQEAHGIIYHSLPSLAGTDRWHKRSGYVDSQAGLCGVVIDPEFGDTTIVEKIVERTTNV